MFESELRRIVDVLILAAAALFEVPALRHDALRRRLQNSQQPRPRKLLLHVGDFDFHFLAHQHEWDKQNQTVHSRDAFASKCDVMNRGDELAADS